MTPTQSKFVQLEKRKEEVKKFLEELAAANEELAKEIGIGGFFQDDEGVVYQVVEPKGKFVHFESVSYVRTKRGNEVRPPDLSRKKAEEAGFILPK